MLSLRLHQQLKATSGPGGPSRCSHGLCSRMSSAGRQYANRASQVPWWGVATVTTWAASRLRSSAGKALSQARTTRPPRLCATISGARPVRATTSRAQPSRLFTIASALSPCAGSSVTAAQPMPRASSLRIQDAQTARLQK